ncbi:MAG TPA: WecB/TagA/CpsF family glycosyltransferase [Streptosporangiaceae bacterium]|nr:WecB/TagA/CpsF family glycosyltransferase [Streptosporangiaceae bacterium]
MAASRAGARITLAGAEFDPITHAALISRVSLAIAGGSGGTIVTPNIDICHQMSRDPASRALVEASTLVVPDGMPLLWASRLAGQPLPERITGADLIYSLSAAAADNGWPVYVVGGLPGQDGQASAAQLAADGLAARYAGLAVAGAYSPPACFDAVAGDISSLLDDLVSASPLIVFVGLGFPKQEQVIERLRVKLPDAWYIGCGAAIPYAAGRLRRAPLWMQRAGLEWLFRLISEPRRLARRYLGRDLPFAVGLLAGACWQRVRSLAPARQS